MVLPTDPPQPTVGRGRSLLSAAAVVLLLFAAAGGGTWFLAGAGDDLAKRETPATSESTRSSPVARDPSQTPSPSTLSISPNPSNSPSEEVSPLDIAATYSNQSCTGQYIVMLATSGLGYEWEPKLGAAVRGVRGAKYLEGGASCSAFLPRSPTGERIYNAYVGPFPDLSIACRALAGLPHDYAWVRQLEEVSPEREACLCVTPPAAMPVLSRAAGVDSSDLRVRRAIAQSQWILFKMGLNRRSSIFGNYGKAYTDAISKFQQIRGVLEPLGDGAQVGSITWMALRAEYCDNPAYDEQRR